MKRFYGYIYGGLLIRPVTYINSHVKYLSVHECSRIFMDSFEQFWTPMKTLKYICIFWKGLVRKESFFTLILVLRCGVFFRPQPPLATTGVIFWPQSFPMYFRNTENARCLRLGSFFDPTIFRVERRVHGFWARSNYRALHN